MLELMKVHESFEDVIVLNGVTIRSQKRCIYIFKGSIGSNKLTLARLHFGSHKRNERCLELKFNKLSSKTQSKVIYKSYYKDE
ncbi:MAG: hypothetical protein FWG98_08280 [Candidatus Cloacimonetes bacterium]|nr:hypothetical protein [Candidatus Cloacimonadota bacterium]